MPLFQFDTPPPKPYYRSPYTGSIADMIGNTGRIAAEQQLRGGQIAAQTAENVGHAISGSLSDFLHYVGDEPRRALLRAEVADKQIDVKRKQDEENESNLIKQTFADVGGDPDQALDALRTKGAVGVNAAAKLQKTINDTRKADVETQKNQLDIVQKRLSTASQFLTGVEGRPETERPSAYAQILPQLRQTVGPDLAKMLPPTYDAGLVQQAITMGETAQQTLERRRAALETAKLALEEGKDQRERDQYYTMSLGQSLPTVENQDDWTKFLGFAKQMGAAEGTLAKFGAEYSPEAARRAASFGLTPEQQTKQVGSIEDYVSRGAKELHVPVASLTTAQLDDLRKRYTSAGKVVDPTSWARLQETIRHNRVVEDPLGVNAPPVPAPTGIARTPANGHTPPPTTLLGDNPAPVGRPRVTANGLVPPETNASATAAVSPTPSTVTAVPTRAQTVPVPSAPSMPTSSAAPAPTGGTTGRNEDALAKLPPPVAAQVRAIVDGKRALDARTASSPYGRQLLALAYAYDPSFDQVNYNARNKTRTDFATGAAAKNVNALNTVIGHLSDLSDAADALNNTWSPTWNSIANAVSSATGDPRVKKFATIQNAVADEATRVWRQAGGTETDIKNWKHDLDAAGSPEQLHGVIATIGDLLHSKLEALQEQYQQGMGTAAISVIAPAAAQALEKLRGRAAAGGGSDASARSITVTSPSGKDYTFASQAAADAAVTAAKKAGLWK